MEIFRQVIQKQRLSADLSNRSFRDLLANIAQGANEHIQHNHSRPDLSDCFFQVAPVRKSKISEWRKTNPTPLAAVLYGPHFYSDEPLPTNQQVTAFSGKLLRLKLWDPAQPTGGLPLVTDLIF